MLLTINEVPWSWRFYYIVNVFFIIFLSLDRCINSPYGLLPLHSFYGNKQDEPSVCGWDYEGSWKIGIAHGSAPYNLKINSSSIITCGTLHSVNASFVADPFLIVPPSSNAASNENTTTSSETKKAKKWYAFYEFKNLDRVIGEIGVAESSDDGKTWTHLGTALDEPFHLSYPFVIRHNRTGDYLMIPETNEANGIRIYRTTEKEFPLGWKLFKVVLEGAPFLDTSAVWFNDRFWILTTIDYELYLFHTHDLLEDWIPHPHNPVVSSLSYARSGGPPVVYDGHIYRFAQDCARYYGEKVHILRVDELVPFKEKEVASLYPGGGALWYSDRFHHVNAHDLGNQHWVALVDGDNRGQYMQFFLREGWFRTLKLVLLFVFLSQFVAVLFVAKHFSRRLFSEKQNPYVHWRKFVYWMVRVAKSSWINLKGVWSSLRSSILLHQPCRSLALFLVILILSIFLTFQLMTIPVLLDMTDLKTCCPDVAFGAPLPSHPSSVQGLQDFIVITAATQYHFDRLENFIGSMHIWEPGQQVVVYDLGLTENQVLQASCWKNVTLKPFPFDNFPLHVRNAYNYAWKPLILADAFETYTSVLALDSGVEIRQPLTQVKELMFKWGYFVASQSNSIEKKTHPMTFDKLKVTREDFIGKTFCSGGIQGYVRNSSAYESVLKRSVQCALDEDCIAPNHSGRENHNYDQSVLSILMYNNGFQCTQNPIFAEGAMDKLTWNELKQNKVVLGLRRWKIPKPYSRHISLKSICPIHLSYEIKDNQVIETSNSFRIEADSTLQTCLRKHNNVRSACASEVEVAKKALTYKERVQIEANLRFFGVLLKHVATCYWTYYVLIIIFLVSLNLLVMQIHFVHFYRRQAALSILEYDNNASQGEECLLSEERARRRRPAFEDDNDI